MDLLAVYQVNMPNDDDDESTTELDENNSLLNEIGTAGEVNIPSLTELVSVLKGNAINEEREFDKNESEFEKYTRDHSDDSALLSGTDKMETAKAAKQLRNLLSASTLGEMIEFVSRGMKLLNLKGRETGSVTKDQKFKSISESWFTIGTKMVTMWMDGHILNETHLLESN